MEPIMMQVILTEEVLDQIADKLASRQAAQYSEGPLRLTKGRHWDPIAVLRLHKLAGPATAKELVALAASMGETNTRNRPVTPQDMNKQHTKLEKSGFVEREYNPLKAANVWQLTDKGVKAEATGKLIASVPKAA